MFSGCPRASAQRRHVESASGRRSQQLVKNTYLTPERTLRRKYAEAMLAFTIERRVSKEDIFALYCNEIYLGQRSVVAIRGVEQASRAYFGKAPKDLTLAEAATIAGMIQGPTRYSPVRQNDAARARRSIVLGTMGATASSRWPRLPPPRKNRLSSLSLIRRANRWRPISSIM